MRVLVADDELVTRAMLEGSLRRCGYEVVTAEDGEAALALLERSPDISLAIVDWVLPGVDGLEVCRRLRARGADFVYVILITAGESGRGVVEGLDAGADDYMTKPFRVDELRARLRVGERTVSLRRALAQKVSELEAALAHVKRLQGILPICMHCKRVRVDKDAWRDIDMYVAQHSEARFSHGICAKCLAERYPDEEEEAAPSDAKAAPAAQSNAPTK